MKERKQNTTVQLITPQLAKEMLENNIINRPIAPATVSAYARDMRNGHWILNHQGIAFDDDGDLIDGQHRLMAIIEAGVPVLMNVTTGCFSVQNNGITIDVMDTVNRGMVRKIGDQLTLFHGIQNGNSVAAACKGIAAFFTNKAIKLTTSQTLQVYRIYSRSIESLYSITDARKKLNSCISPPIIILHNNDPETALEFSKKFCSLDNIPPMSPVKALMKWVERHESINQIKEDTGKVVCSCLRNFKTGQSMALARPSDDAKNWLISLERMNYRKVRDLLGIKN